jgi:hypothetical protein
MNAEELTELYYKTVVGCYPWKTDNNKRITCNTIQFLLDSNIEIGDIWNILSEIEDGIVKPSLLPDGLWKDSLIKRNVYYTHHSLQITSPTTTIDKNGCLRVASDWWIEIKPRFTMLDLIEYYYTKLYDAPRTNTQTQDIGAFTFMYDKYNRYISHKHSTYVDVLDVLLTAIDTAAKEKEGYLSDPLQLQGTIDTLLKPLCSQNKLGFEQGNCQIIWRSHLIKEEFPEEETGPVDRTKEVDLYRL